MRGRSKAAAIAAVVVLGNLSGWAPAGAEAERMHLRCDGGLVIERTNGSSWWGLSPDGSWDGTVYTTRSLSIVDEEGSIVHEQRYGDKGGRFGTTTCVASHFGWTWTVELVRHR